MDKNINQPTPPVGEKTGKIGAKLPQRNNTMRQGIA